MSEVPLTSENVKPKVVRLGPRTTTRSKSSAKKKPRDMSTGVVRTRAIHPWDEIRTYFIEGSGEDGGDVIYPNLKQAAEKFGVGHPLVRDRSSKERWPEKRALYQSQIARKRQSERQKLLVKNAVGFDEKAYRVADLGIAMITTRLAEIAQEVQRTAPLRADALRRQGEGLPVERHELWSAVNYREMEGLASAASRFQEIGMRSLGTDIVKHEITGSDGGPIETQTIQIVAELNRDDPERFANLVHGLIEAGLVDEAMIANGGNIIDVEVINDGATEG